MATASQLALNDPAEWLGDWHPLAEQLGSADGLVALGSVSSLLRVRPVQNVSSLRELLRDYHGKILFPFELPAIESAHGHATRNELRELVALDCRLAAEPILQQFAEKMETEAAKAIYRQRGAVAEFPNAWIKDKLGLRQFRLRGLVKVRLEVLWAALTYNIQQWIRLSWRAGLAAASN